MIVVCVFNCPTAIRSELHALICHLFSKELITSSYLNTYVIYGDSDSDSVIYVNQKRRITE